VMLRPHKYVPANVDLVSGDLDDYGHWVSDPSYGHVWVPSADSDPDWRPYYHGRWTWVDPYGWTWVSAEPWGWAPYHYGTWVHRPHYWGWVPGPVHQYWSPGVVDFTYTDGNVAWAALAPAEVRYPSALTVGFSSGNWSLFFSIGGAAVYDPIDAGYCVARPWNNYYVNRGVQVTNITNITNIYNGGRPYNSRFVPTNSRFGGSVVTSVDGFRGRGSFRPGPANNVGAFQRGQALRFAGRPFSGPAAAAPLRSSFSPTRSFTANRPAPGSFSRNVFHAPRVATGPTRRPIVGMPARPAGGAAAPNGRASRFGQPTNNVPRPGSIGQPNYVARPNNVARPSTPPRWNPNARVNPAQAAAQARRSLNVPQRGAVSRPGFGNRNGTFGNQRPGAQPQVRPNNPAQRTLQQARPNNPPQRRQGNTFQPRQQARPNNPAQRPHGNSFQPQPRQAPQRSAQPRQPQRSFQPRQAPQRSFQPRQQPQRSFQPRQQPQRSFQPRQQPQRPQQPRQQPQQRQPRQAPNRGGGDGHGHKHGG
jgi:hypothetical protein